MPSMYDFMFGNLNNFGGSTPVVPPRLNMPNPGMGFANQLNTMMPRAPINPNPMMPMPNPGMGMNPAPINPQTLGVNPSSTNPMASGAQGGASPGATPGAPGMGGQDSLRKMMMAQYLASMMGGGGGGSAGMGPQAAGALPIAAGGSPGGLPGAGGLQSTNVMSMPLPLPPKRRFIGNMDSGYTPSTMGY